MQANAATPVSTGEQTPIVAPITSTYSVANLTPADRAAITAAGHAIPLPGDELGVLRLYRALQNTANISLMIAAAALRQVTKCVDDKQLHPTPHRKAPVRTPKTDEEKARVKAEATKNKPNMADVLTTVAPNPKRPGSASYDRYANYITGYTRAQLLAKGVLRADIAWDEERGFIVFTPAETTPEV